VGRELGRTFDLDDLLANILDLLRQVVVFDAAAIYVLDRGGLSAVHQSMRGYEEAEARALAIKLDEGLVGWVARTGEAVVVPDVTQDGRYLLSRRATRSEMVVPLKSGGRVIGVFNLESDRPAAYSPHDLELLATFANQAGAAVDRARMLAEGEAAKRLEQELRIARKIQQEFLPDPQEIIRGGAISGTTIFSTEVSGDYYDFLARSDGSLAVAVADVAGKGMPAALIMSSLRAAFRLSAKRVDDPVLLCRELNTFLYASLRETEFVTGVFALLDRDQTVFHYTNAGHNQPLLLHADGSCRWLDCGGMLLGAFSDLQYESERVSLFPGDRVILYTDGVTEAHPGDHEEFGMERLLGVARAQAGKPPREIQNAIIQAVKEYVGGPLPDDLTLVVLAGCEGAGK
jgi:serine phosphatase RsbU (regulator of sigma subunit)